MKLSSFGKVLVRFSSAQVISNILRLVAGFLIVRIIAPELYGIFSGVGVFLGYVMMGHLGVISGLGRELPYQLGKGKRKMVKEYANIGLWVSIFVGIIASIIFSYFAIHNYLGHGDLNLTLVYTCYAILGFFHIINNAYLPVLYRTNNDFNKLSRINIISGIVNIISVLLVVYFSFYGLLIRAILVILIRFFLLYYYKPFKLSPKYDYKSLKNLIKIGIPIYAVGQVRPLWNTIQNTILFSVGGALQFGFYALVNIINGAVGVIPGSFSQVVYPRMAIQLGEGLGKNEILKQVKKPTIFQFSLLFVIAIIGSLLLPYIIPIILPKYVNGVAAAQWAFFIPVIQSLGLVNNYYNVVKKQKFYVISLVIGAIIGLGYVLFMLQLKGFNLVFFPQGIIIGSIIQIFLSVYFLFYKLKVTDIN